MKTFNLLLLFAILGIISCSKAKTSNASVNTQTPPPVVSASNSNTNSNANSLNKSGITQTQSEVNSEMLRKIEAQQLETADPRRVANKNKESANQSSKTTSSGKQTW